MPFCIVECRPEIAAPDLGPPRSNRQLWGSGAEGPLTGAPCFPQSRYAKRVLPYHINGQFVEISLGARLGT
jgi:hypothetical protein